jgi:hypothetical protein
MDLPRLLTLVCSRNHWHRHRTSFSIHLPLVTYVHYLSFIFTVDLLCCSPTRRHINAVPKLADCESVSGLALGRTEWTGTARRGS